MFSRFDKQQGARRGTARGGAGGELAVSSARLVQPFAQPVVLWSSSLVVLVAVTGAFAVFVAAMTLFEKEAAPATTFS